MSGSAHKVARARNSKSLARLEPRQDVATSAAADSKRPPESDLAHDSVTGGATQGLPWETRASANNVTLTLRGEITIADAVALHKELLQVVARGLEIQIELAHAVYLDAAILQLITATRQTAVAMGVQFALQHVPQGVIESAQTFGMGSVLMDSTSAGER